MVKVKDHETKDGRFPVRDGVKFMIRSQMSGNRMLYPNERFNSGRERLLRIRDFSAHVRTAYWTFDSRTNTIRNPYYRNWVLSNRMGYGFRIGQHATIRPYTGEKSQPIKFYGGNRKNIRNRAGKCLDVHGARNIHNRHVIWWNCHNGANQGWMIATISRKPSYRQPLRDGVKFYIRSNMSGGRNLFWHEHIGGNQFRLRIHNFDVKYYRRNWKIADKGQWVFDSRTRTIRAHLRRNFCISNQAGQRFNIGRPAVIRQWRREVEQKIRVYGGSRRNIRNDGGKCLDVHGNSNRHMRHVIWWNCHNGANQGWTLVKTSNYKVVVKYQNPPLRDGVPFQFRNMMSQHRALFVDFRAHIGRHQYKLGIQNHAPWQWQQWFVFDRRTRSIRSSHRRNFAISREIGTRRFVAGGNAVARPWRNTVWQRTFYNRAKNVQDWGNIVLTPHGFANRHRNYLTWWWNKNHAGQRWRIDTKGVRIPKSYPLKDGVKFQIKSRMSGNRALFRHEHIGHHQYRLRIRNNMPWNDKQWFVFDHRTRTIRASSDRKLSLSNQYGYGWRIGVAAVMRPWRNSDY